jgi:hypothetical protein
MLYKMTKGFRGCYSTDGNTLKVNAADMLSTKENPVIFDKSHKSDRGFSHDTTGRLLAPIEYIEEYDNNPLAQVEHLLNIYYY